MKITIEKYNAAIKAGKNRGRAGNARGTFWGETGLPQGVLPRLIPDMLGGEADERKK